MQAKGERLGRVGGRIVAEVLVGPARRRPAVLPAAQAVVDADPAGGEEGRLHDGRPREVHARLRPACGVVHACLTPEPARSRAQSVSNQAPRVRARCDKLVAPQCRGATLSCHDASRIRVHLRRSPLGEKRRCAGHRSASRRPRTAADGRAVQNAQHASVRTMRWRPRSRGRWIAACVSSSARYPLATRHAVAGPGRARALRPRVRRAFLLLDGSGCAGLARVPAGAAFTRGRHR